MTQESAWQTTWQEALDGTGWTWLHVRPAILPAKGTGGKGRWLTPTTKGFPDLLALRDGHLLVVELKIDGRYPAPAQRVWLELFALVPGSLVWVSRPGDQWDDIAGWLQRPDLAPRLYGWEPASAKAARVSKRRPAPTRGATT